jgi:hypothetical protein
MPTPHDDTVRIGRHPGLVNWRLIASASLGVGAALGSFAAAIFAALGAGDWSWPLGVLAVWLVFGGSIALGVSLAYSVIVFDPTTRTASLRRRSLSLRRRTVSFDSITEAYRALSSGVNGAGYLVYRFVSTEGANARVLVRGTPMRGLDADGLRRLAQFVDGLPLQAPDAPLLGSAGDSYRAVRGTPALTERQQALAVSLTTGGGTSRVGREILLEELLGIIDEAGPGESGVPIPVPRRSAPRAPGRIRGLIALFADDRRERGWEDDDKEAEAILASSPGGARRWRRRFFRLILADLGLIVVGLILSALMNEFGSPLPEALSEDILFFSVLGAFALGIGLSLAWCAAADTDVRHRRRLALSWMAARDFDVDEHGLATPFITAWREPICRLRTALGYLSALSGAMAVIVAIAAYAGDALGRDAGIGTLVSGLALTTVGVVLLIGITRQRRADAQEFVLLAGRRLLPTDPL